MEVFNLYGDDWDRVEERDGWRSRATRVGDRLGAELLGATHYELEPGNRLWPYHLHHANEEWLLVLSGRPTLRTPAGEQELREGDIACFRRGHGGAHQLRNDTTESVRVLMLSTNAFPEILEYPDSGKVATRDARGEPLSRHRPGPELEYWEGES